MGIRIYRPITPGRRKSSVNDYAELVGEQTVQKNLVVKKKGMAGRNAQGKITVRHRGSGNRVHYRQVDFLENRYNDPATVLGIQYDPNRSTHIALIEFPNRERRYILAPAALTIGAKVVSSPNRVDINPGNRTTLENIPTGIPIHNIEIRPGRGGILVRSAGNNATLMSIEGNDALLRLPSGEIRRVSKKCLASVGQLSNIDHGNIRYGKAGRRRWKGWRPSVRGKAMNPVDHPHGGGEGNQPIGLKYPKTPWGKHALGVRTRRKKKYSNARILTRRTK